MFVAVLVGAAVVPVSGLPVVAVVAAILTIVLAVPQTLLEVVTLPPSIVLLIDGNVPESMLVAVSVGTRVFPISGLLMVAAVAAVLTIVLAVLPALLKVPSIAELIVVAVAVQVAIMILVLLCGNCGSHTRRAEPGEGHSEG